MQMTVAIETVNGNGFRAHSGEPLVLFADGKTEEEAVANLRRAIRERLATGMRLISLDLPGLVHPLQRFAGMYDPNDPDVQDWLQIMQENRRLADEDPNVP